MLREKFYRHALEYVQPDRAKRGAIVFFAPAGKSLNIIENIDGLSLVDTCFAPRNSRRPLFSSGHATLFHWSWGSL